jgi:hypothetical protein
MPRCTTKPSNTLIQHFGEGLGSNARVFASALCPWITEMNTRFAIQPLRLGRGELFSVSDGEGFTVACLEGSVWITQSDDARDISLTAGQAFVLDKPGVALVCAAAGPAALAIERSPPPLAPYFWDMRNAARNLSARGRVKPMEGARRERDA